MIETENQIKYIDGGLFGVYSDDSYGTEKVFDLLTNEYVPFPKNTIMATYESGRLLLYEKGKEPYVDKREIVIDISDKEIVSFGDGEVILETSYRSIKALHDTGNKYFFLTKEGEGTEEDEYFIFDSQTKTIIGSDCDDMEEFIYGLSLGHNYAKKSFNL